jgi:hypothetical protein
VEISVDDLLDGHCATKQGFQVVTADTGDIKINPNLLGNDPKALGIY